VKATRLFAAGLILAALLSAGCSKKKPKAGEAPKEVLPVATLYAKGQEALAKKKPVTARRYFDQITLREDAGDYKDKATIAIADSYFIEHTLETYAEAIGRYQSFLAFHPTHYAAAYCQYRIALAYYEEMESPDRDMTPATYARDAFQALIENYPNCEYVKDSKEKIAEVTDLMAAHEITVGDWYLKHGHNSSAAGRYRYVIEKYPKYWNMPVVYYRLGDALARDGQTQEALLYFTRVTQETQGTSVAKSAQKEIARIEKRGGKDKGGDKKALDEPLTKPKDKSHWWQFWK
jgi:outer membrane protein assembly factor BamD